MEAVFKEKSYPANYPADALAIIEAMSFSKGKSVHIMGSMAMRSQQYAGDYDLFEEVQTKGAEHQALRDLADRFKDIVKTLLGAKNVYVGDIKSGAIAEWEILNTNAGIVDGKIVNFNAVESNHRIDELEKAKIISGGEAKYARSLIKESMTPEDLIEAKKELKFHIVRWSPQEVINGSKVLRDKKRYTLEEAFSSHSLTKLDVIGFIENNRFTDFSMIYEFFNKGKALNDFPLNVAQSLKEDVIYYKAHGNHFKVLKRMLAIAKLNKDSDAVNKLIPILNSDLGRLYLIISDVGTLIELLENERKVPMPLVRFQLDQMKARMGNIYNLPDFLSEEHDLIGDINAILKMTNKPQLLSRLHQIKTKMEGILNTNAKAKGGRRGGATERERGIAARMREKYYSGTNKTPFSNNLYQDLSLITHDPYDDSVADGKGVATVYPHLTYLAKGLLSGVMPSGYPLERQGFRDPATGIRLPPPPANTGVASELPADNTWFEPSGRYNETNDVWKSYILGNKTARKIENQYKNSIAVDDAALVSAGFAPILFNTTDFPTANPAVYNRFSANPAPALPQPPVPKTFADAEEQATPEEISHYYAENLREDDATRMEELRAELEAQRAIDEQAFLAEFPKRDEAEISAYDLLIKEQLAEAREKVREQLEATRGNVLASPEFDSAVGDFTGDILNQARQELAQDPAYQAERRSQDVEYQARLAQEAQARAEAQDAEARARAEQDRAVKEGVKQAEKEGKAREKEAQAKGQPLEQRVNKARLDLITDKPDRTQADALIALLKANRESLKQLSKAKGELLRTKRDLDLHIAKEAKLKREGKPSKGDKAALKQRELEGDVAVAEQAVEFGEGAVAEIPANEAKLEALLAKYPVPVKREDAQRGALARFNEALMGKKVFDVSSTDSLDAIIGKIPKLKTDDALLANVLPQILVEDTKISEEEARAMAKNIDDNFDTTPQVLGSLESFSRLGKTITGNFFVASKEIAPLKEALDKGEITKEEWQRQYETLINTATRTIAIKLLWWFYSNPYNIMIYKYGIDDEDRTTRVLKNSMIKMLRGEFVSEAESKELSFKEAEASGGMRQAILEIFGRLNLPEALIANAEGVSDKELMEATQIANGAIRLIRPEIEATINSQKQLEASVKYWERILTGDGSQDEHMFSAGNRAPVQAWLSQARDTLSKMSQKGKETVYLACALKGFSNMSVLTSVAMPKQVWLGDPYMLFQPPKEGEGRVRRQVPFAKSPIDAYRGRRRGGKLPASGVLSEDRATRQKELRAMTREELNGMRDVSLADKQLFYAIHTEIPIRDVPFHKKGRDAVQAMRDSVARPTEVPQIPYGEASPALGQRGVALKPANTQYKYFRWVYPWLKPEYVADQRAKGVSDLAIRYNTREKEYITDWLDTPTPPARWGKPGMIGNHTPIGTEDWGVEKRVNPNPPRVASGRVRNKTFAQSMKELMGKK